MTLQARLPQQSEARLAYLKARLLHQEWYSFPQTSGNLSKITLFKRKQIEKMLSIVQFLVS